MSLELERNRGPRRSPVLLVIMDGMGCAPAGPHNAIAHARTPHLDRLATNHEWLKLAAHGTAVGLPSDEDMGNSEVGHNALGAGRVFPQGARLINEAFASGAAFEGRAWQTLTAPLLEHGGALHLIGLLSDGNVHSHIDHLLRLLTASRDAGIRCVRIHILLDGRDVAPTSALEYIDRLESWLESNAHGPEQDYRIASGGGRMHITMDRYEADWPMVERGWQTHVLGEGPRFSSARAAVEAARAETPGIIDQDLPAFVVTDGDAPVGPIRDGDSVLLFNFRGDRAIELCRAFEEEDFEGFARKQRPSVRFAGIMEYDGDLHIPKHYLIDPPAIDRPMGAYLAASGVSQFACSETQKFGHVTYFWNGNRSSRFSDRLERYVEIPSGPGPFDQDPEMRAQQVTNATLEALGARSYDFLRINLANGDMVGHTGNFDAAVKAVEAVDQSIGRLLEGVAAAQGIALITADHGNADDMTRTSHTLAPVPLYLYAPAHAELALRSDLERPGLANVAATIIDILGFHPPSDYNESLIKMAEPAPSSTGA